MNTHGARSRAGRARLLQLPEDPEAAFRIRMDVDRAEIARLAKGLTRTLEGPKLARVLAALEELAHGLAGSSGVFGYPELGEAAMKVEHLAERYRRLNLDALSARRQASLTRAITALLEELAS